jgi:hypothetical protein
MRESRRRGDTSTSSSDTDTTYDQSNDSLALLWQEVEDSSARADVPAGVNRRTPAEIALMLDERSKLIAELSATERTMATTLRQALRVYFEPLVGKETPTVAPAMRVLAETDRDGDLLSMIGALQLVAAASERLALQIDNAIADAQAGAFACVCVL